MQLIFATLQCLNIRKGGFISAAFGLLLALFAPSGHAFAQDHVSAPDIGAIVSALHIKQTGSGAHLELDLSTSVSARAFVVENPDRLIVDLPQVSFKTSMPRFRHRKILIKSFRYGLFAAGQSRVVMDLAAPVKILATKIEPGADGAPTRLVVDIEKTDRATFHTAAEDTGKAASPAASPASPPAVAATGTASKPSADSNLPLDNRPLIVVDPGHGGPDSGAIGVDGAVEKVVVFDFATVLKARLEATGRYRVILTRNQDVFVPLGERTQIARAANADLFLSIHADTLSDVGSVSGATVYTVSNKASDAEAARVAAHENQADAAGGLVTADQAPEVADILFDLTRRETRSYAHVFSKSLVAAWKSGPFLSLNKNPQRSAGFVVLKAPDVPSVLLELGYLSNSKDVKNLVSPEWRDTAATSVLKAVDSFFIGRNPGKKVETTTAADNDLQPLASVKSAPILNEP